MSHPGRIIYAHPPQTHGVRFFYITYSRRRGLCVLRAAPVGGETVETEVHPLDLLQMLQDGTACGVKWDPEVVRKATRALKELAVRRGLL